MTFNLMWTQVRPSWIKKNIFIMLKFKKQKNPKTPKRHSAGISLNDYLTVQCVVLKFAALGHC